MSSKATAEDLCAVYRRECAYVFNVLRRLGVDRGLLEDFTHDVFTVVFRRWSAYDPTRPIRPWLFGIAYRLVRDSRRKLENRAIKSPQPPDDVSHPGPTAEEESSTREARDLALSFIAAMEIERRAVFVMHELEGYSMPEIADVLAVPLNTAYSRLRLARQEFNAAVVALRNGDARDKP